MHETNSTTLPDLVDYSSSDRVDGIAEDMIKLDQKIEILADANAQLEKERDQLVLEKVGICFYPLPHNPGYNNPEQEAFWKQGGKKEKKMLVTSIFPSPHSISYSVQKQVPLFDSHRHCQLQMLWIWTSLHSC